jgi:hypothetical protein
MVDRIRGEINLMRRHPNYETPPETEKIIIDQAKSFGYDFEEDPEATDYFLKATPFEVWEYWLTNIIPNFDKRKNIVNWEQEIEKCKASPYYFMTRYYTVDGEPFETLLSEAEFNRLFNGEHKRLHSPRFYRS